MNKDKFDDSIHPQVDSGYGFTCDKNMLEVVKMIWGIGFKTLSCCQNTNDTDEDQRAVPRSEITFTHENPFMLLILCMHIRSVMGKRAGWSQNIICDGYYNHKYPFSLLTYIPQQKRKLIDAIKGFKVQF